MSSTDISAPQAIGFIGLGAMGSGMAATLARGGFHVKAFDLDAARRAQFEAESGQSAASSLQDAFCGVAAVVTMLPDGAVLRRVLLGCAQSESPLDGARDDLLLIDCSSCAPLETQDLARDLAARGLQLVDAPVSGGVPGTKSGSLTMMAGGEPSAVARAHSILHCLGKTVYHTGPSGSGHAMKTLVNYIGTSQMLLDFQVLLIGQRFGLAGDKMVEILNRSYAKNLSTEIVLSQQILSGAYAHNFSLGLATKDALIAAQTAEALGFGDNSPRHFAQILERAKDQLGAEVDLTRVYDHFNALWHDGQGAQP